MDKTSLEKACEFVVDCPHSTPVWTESGVLVFRSNNIRNGRLDLSQQSFTSEEQYAKRVARAVPSPGDLIITREAPMGEVALIPKGVRGCLGQRVVLLRPDPTVMDGRFMLYALMSPEVQNEIGTHEGSGSTVSNLRIPSLKALELPCPPLEEQRAIGHILGTLDDKIGLNRRMNETLEAMARGFFKSWFVDFDPVRAKSEGLDSGLPQPLADLFPDSFEDSELGEIPMGWKLATLGDLAVLNSESWSKETHPEQIDYVDLSSTKWGRIERTTRHSRQDAPSRAQRVLRQADTIVGTVRPGNGSYAFVSTGGLTASTGFAVLRPRRLECAEFVYLAATDSDNIDRLSQLADGGAYPAVRPEVVASAHVIRPCDAVITRFSMLCGPLLAKMAQNERTSAALATLRDTLLPKLLSGEVTPDVTMFKGDRANG